MICCSRSAVVSYFVTLSNNSFLDKFREFDCRSCRFMFVFLTTFAYFYLGLVATTLRLLAGSCLKLRVEGNFFNFKLVDDSFFLGSSIRLFVLSL